MTISQGNITNAYSGSSDSVSVTIRDNDITPTATISRVKGFEIQEGASSFLQLKATLDSVTTRDVIVKLKSSGDASNDDYTVSTIPSDTSGFRPLQMVLGQIQGQNESHLSGVWTLVEENDNSYHQWIYEPNRSDYVNSSFRMSATSGDNQYPGNSDLWKWSDAGGDNGATLSCMMDDSFTFGENGTFRIELGSKTNIWTTQAESCDTPVAPFISGTDYKYELLTNHQIGGLTYQNVIKLKGKGAYMGWSSAGLENSEERYYGIKFIGPNFDYLVVDELTDHPNLKGSWIRYVFTRKNTSFSPNKSIATGEIAQQITIPAGQKEINAYLLAIDDTVFNEGTEELNVEVDTVIYGKVGSSSSIFCFSVRWLDKSFESTFNELNPSIPVKALAFLVLINKALNF